jgi:hypothetical protein
MHDIVFPAIAYSLKDYSWDEDEAVAWADKEHGLYWAGSTTGTYVENWTEIANFEQAHRERFVLLANGYYDSHGREETYLHRHPETKTWQPKKEPGLRTDSYHAFFAGDLVQCEEHDGCQMMRDLLEPYITEDRPRDEGSQYTLVFDTDGNGHSGRYYRLLMSHSLPLKQTIFREWHDDRLIPWVHFVPVSLGLEELPELVRFLVEEEEGRALAEELAAKGREWAMRCLRELDQMIYFWRLALEMGRLEDVEREAGGD